jgi:hypothetical protein
MINSQINNRLMILNNYKEWSNQIKIKSIRWTNLMQIRLTHVNKIFKIIMKIIKYYTIKKIRIILKKSMIMILIMRQTIMKIKISY